MNRYQLESRIRSIGIAYLLLFIAGAQYAYLNKWGTQILFWITFGGLGIWWIIDIFRLPGMIHEFNDPIFDEIDYLERGEDLELDNRIPVRSMANVRKEDFV